MVDIKTVYGEKQRVQTVFSGVTKVEQCHRDSCNINSIMSRYHKTGLLPGRGAPGFYGDFTNVLSYQDSCDKIMESNVRFMSLPAEVRKEFDNSPAKLLAFLENDDNRDKAIELGILSKPEPSVDPDPKPEPEPVVEPVVPPK